MKARYFFKDHLLEKAKYVPFYKACGGAVIKNGITQSWIQISILLLSNYDLEQTVFSLRASTFSSVKWGLSHLPHKLTGRI